MNPTILIDLDDTLIDNPMDVFLSTYLKLLGSSIGKNDSTEYTIQEVKNSIESMMKNNSPLVTLREAFRNTFIPAVNSNEIDMKKDIEDFYNNIYPTIKNVTNPIPSVIPFIEELENQNYTIAIATNPYFPYTAIQQRLEWANLPVENHRFQQITTFDNYHFGKPNPAYFTELMANLGWPEGPVLMIGNDLNLDILPAQSLGYATFWVTQKSSDTAYEKSPYRGEGSIDQIIPWLERVPFESFQHNYKNPSSLVSMLKGNLAALDTLQRKLSVEKLDATEIDGWSIGEILIHLFDVDKRINLPRFSQIINEDTPFIEGQNPNNWITKNRYKESDKSIIFDSFASSRIELISLLENLSEQEWQKNARHSIFGPTGLIELVDFAARHDRIHIRQIHQIIKDRKIIIPKLLSEY